VEGDSNGLLAFSHRRHVRYPWSAAAIELPLFIARNLRERVKKRWLDATALQS